MGRGTEPKYFHVHHARLARLTPRFLRVEQEILMVLSAFALVWIFLSVFTMCVSPAIS